MKSCFYAILILFFTAPVFASVNISNPSNGEHVNSPFSLSASSTNCSDQVVHTMGYSLDNSSDTTMVHNTSIDTSVNTATGYHVVHVKAWGASGAVCVTDVAVTVETSGGSASSDASSSSVPGNASSVSSVQVLSNWHGTHDGGTPGWASGKMWLTSSPSHSGTARGFASSFSGSGGERYSVSFGDDRTSTNFVYDGWVYLTSSANNIANLEMDLNQTMPNGQTVIYGVQCSGYSGTWEFTENAGSAWHPYGRWISSGAKCNVRNWGKYQWHHIQISYSRNNYGTIHYDAVYLDGAKSTINRTVFGARALGWGSSLVTNFQIDGSGSGSNTVFLDDLVIYRW